MIADIIFARHGNTFDPGQTVVWVGSETDMPLVARGLAQAAAAAVALRRSGLVPDVIWTATLRRTRQFADIVAAHLGLAAPRLDARLNEVHYGRWAGKTSDQIAALDSLAPAALAAWNANDVWPDAAGWESRREDVVADLSAFVAENLDAASGRRALVVSSNGILRFLPRLLSVDRRPSFKMATGHLGLLVGRPDHPHIEMWDVAPEVFLGESKG